MLSLNLRFGGAGEKGGGWANRKLFLLKRKKDKEGDRQLLSPPEQRRKGNTALPKPKKRILIQTLQEVSKESTRDPGKIPPESHVIPILLARNNYAGTPEKAGRASKTSVCQHQCHSSSLGKNCQMGERHERPLGKGHGTPRNQPP